MNRLKRDLIVFGEDWGGLPSSTQHLMKHLAEERRIIWVNSIGLRQIKLNLRDITRAGKKLFFFLNDIFKKNEKTHNASNISNISIINPISIPSPKGKFARKLAAIMLTRQIRPVIKKHNFDSPIVWSSLPTTSDVVGMFGEHANVYYCGDDFSGLAGVDHEIVERHEKELAEKSDLIIASSKNLHDKFPANKSHTLFHGVDFDLFSNATKRALDFPTRIRPTAGFYGSLSSWLDIDLLEKCIESLPNWNFVFIGREHIDVSRLKKFSNAFFLGERPHQELPSYSQHWNVSLLPFKSCKQIDACNPLKLYEYLAVGKPIVASRFPAIAPHKDLILQTNSAEEFIHALKISVDLDSLPRFTQVSKSRVVNKTWLHKSQQVSEWLDAL